MNCSYVRVSTDDETVEVQMRRNVLMVTQLDRKLGRKLKLPPHRRRDAIRLSERGELLQEIARSYNLSQSTVPRLPPFGTADG